MQFDILPVHRREFSGLEFLHLVERTHDQSRQNHDNEDHSQEFHNSEPAAPVSG
jgi:hypothetical protein